VLLAIDAAEVAPAPDAPMVLRDVRARLRREDRIWVQGPNGAGKTTLVDALLAASSLPPGRLLHLPQELPAGAGRALLGELRAAPAEERGRVLCLVAALGSDPARLLASADPSPGEARKLALALGMGRHAWARADRSCSGCLGSRQYRLMRLWPSFWRAASLLCWAQSTRRFEVTDFPPEAFGMT
jgi:hypothetical protein